MAAPNGVDPRHVEWVSFSSLEARSGIGYMKAVCRGKNIVHWSLKPVIEVMEPSRGGWLLARGIARGIDGHGEEFELPTSYPWFIESRKALQDRPRSDEADGVNTEAASDPYDEQFYCASSAGLLGLILEWEKNC